VAAVVCWGFGPILVRLADLPGLALSLYRLWLGFALMVPVWAATRRPPALWALRAAAPAGVLFGANLMLFVGAVRLTSVASATLIQVLQPALVLLVAGRWFGERVGAREVLWTAVSIGGVTPVVLGSAGTPAWNPLGGLLAVGALLTWTGYFLAARRARQRLATIELTAYVMLIAALVATPVALVSGQDLHPRVGPAGSGWGCSCWCPGQATS
jgi:drug/metabolite transporter (DMT)-like permease